MTIHLAGTGDAPLSATRRYAFTATTEPEPRLSIPYTQRNASDDVGAVEHEEQEAFVVRVLTALGVPARTGFPGEWLFEEAAHLEAVVEALRGSLCEASTTVPTASARRVVTPAEAGATSVALPRRFLELVGRVAGLVGFEWIELERRVDAVGDESTRTERWRRGEVCVKATTTAIESGYGAHGVRATYVVDVSLSGDRDVQATARLDVRTGGEVAVTIRGVRDGQALAEAFVAR